MCENTRILEKEKIMPNKNTCLWLIMFSFMAITGCDNIYWFIQSGPKEVLNNYLDASLKNRSEEAYKYVSSEDQSAKSLDEYKAETVKKGNAFSEIITSNVSFKVLTVTETGDSAKADVEITRPDMGVMFKDLMGAAFKSAFGGKENSDLKKELMKKYENEEFPTTTKKEDFHLVKEKEGWKIFLGWKDKKEAREKEKAKRKKQAGIEVLLLEAKTLRVSKDFTGAIQKYEEALALGGETFEARNAIREIKFEREAIKEKQTYFNKVVLYDLKAKYYETLLEGRLPGVEFKLKNKGDRTLKKVEVTVYFKDAKGTIIAEKEYHPVLKTSYSLLSRNNKPLKPNYIWQMERGKFYKADSVPSEWKEGRVSAKITNIEFL
jgi:hypothetical protein